MGRVRTDGARDVSLWGKFWRLFVSVNVVLLGLGIVIQSVWATFGVDQDNPSGWWIAGTSIATWVLWIAFTALVYRWWIKRVRHQLNRSGPSTTVASSP